MRRLQGVGVVTVATAFSALIGWLTLLVVGRMHGPVIYAEFAAWWSLYFGAAGVLLGLQQEVVRSQLDVKTDSSKRRPTRELAALVVPLVALVVVAGVGLTSVHSSTLVWPGLPLVLLLVTLLVLTAEAQGLLIAAGRWRMLAVHAGLDSVVRLALVLVLLREWKHPVAYLAAIASGVVVFVPIAAFGFSRFGRRARFGGPGFVSRAGIAMLGSGCFGILSVGIPALVGLTGPAPSNLAASLFATIVLLRSPMLLGVAAIRPALMRYLAQERVEVRLGRTVLLLAAATSVAGAASWFLGPTIVGATFGDGFRPEPGAASVVGAGGVLLVLLSVSGTYLVAVGRPVGALCGWVAAVVVTMVMLWLPLSFEIRTGLALIAGPLAGLLGHAAALTRSGAGSVHGDVRPTTSA